MATPFSDWTLADAKLAVQLPDDDAARIEACRQYYQGNHFRDWEGWTGPTPLPTDPDYALVRSEIARGFVCRGVIREVVDRHTNGVLGRNVKWSLVPQRKLAPDETPAPDEQARMDEAHDLLTGWVAARKLNQAYDSVAATLCVAGMALQRLFVAPGVLGEDGTVPAGDMAAWLGRIYVQFPQPGEATVYIDPRTQAQCGIYVYREIAGSRPSQTRGKVGDERAELTYLDGNETVIRLLGKGLEDADNTGYPVALGGRLLLSDLHRPPLINAAVISQQKLLNKTLSMKSRNMDLAGFRERVTYNARMGGTLEIGPDGVERFVRDSLPVGAGSMTNLTGYITRDAQGNETLATPGMQWIDPVPVSSFLETEASAYAAILAECNQLHYAMSNDATASGESRQVAMAAYLIDLLQTKQQIDAGWAWLLETALTLAATLSAEPNRFSDLKVVAECSVDPGPISSEMITVTSGLIREGHLSHLTGLSWMGVELPADEIAQINIEAAERAEMFPESTNDEKVFERDLNAQLADLEKA